VNTHTQVYHKEGSRFYGKTKEGKYMAEQACDKRRRSGRLRENRGYRNAGSDAGRFSAARPLPRFQISAFRFQRGSFVRKRLSTVQESAPIAKPPDIGS
jgi:hypothetical protein